MIKFKSLHESQKPLIHLMPESYLEYIGGLIPSDHLCRMVKEVVFSLDTEPIEAKYSFLQTSGVTNFRGQVFNLDINHSWNARLNYKLN